MKIDRIQTYLTDATASADGLSDIGPFLLISLETDGGIKGWGEAFINTDNGAEIVSQVVSLGDQVIEQIEIDPHSFYQQYCGEIETRGFDFACAMSAIEIALWDLQGKLTKQPVYELIGNFPVRDIPVYANTWRGKVIEIPALARQCQSLAGQGYEAIKIYPLKYGSAENAGECIKAVRQAVGNDIDILLDISAITDPALALECAQAVTPYNPYWFEEPHTGDDLETLADIRRQAGLIIVTGEKHVGKSHFENAIKLGAADILNPDIAACGGIREILEIARMAEGASIKVSPHCWNSMTVALAAMLQVCTVMPNAEMAEIFPSYLAFGEQFCQTDFCIEKSMARLGNATGLGIDIDEAALARLSTSQHIN